MIGKNISHYQIFEKLGEGGMGVVYRAHDTRLDRDVALKFLPHHIASDENDKQRFILEAKAASALDHPNICTIHEIDETPDHNLFIVMSYYEGETLKKRIEQGPLKTAEAIDLAIQLTKGLAKAHAHGIIHRDIKPANIIVTAEGTAKILDFGLAKLGGQTLLTKTGTTVGTAAYMSPEQAQGGKVDQRSDIWSLGVVLYEMLTGQRPFAGEYEQAVIYSIINEEPPPIGNFNPDVPPALEAIVKKALQKNKEDRYQQLDELLSALGVLSGTTVKGTDRHRVFTGHKPFLYVAAVFLLLLVVAAVSFLLRPVPEVRAIESIAVLPLSNLIADPEQQYFVDGFTETLINGIAQLGYLKVISRTTVVRYRETDKPLSEIASELNVDAILEGSLQQVGDNFHVILRLIDAASDQHIWADDYYYGITDVLQVQSEVVRSIAREIDIRLTPEQQTRLASPRRVDPAVYEAYLRGIYFITQYSEESIERGMKYLHEAVALDPAEPLAYAGLAEGYVTIGHSPDPPPETFPRAKAAAEKALSLDPDNVQAISALADIALYHEWDWEKAEDLFERVKKLNPSLAMNYYHYAWQLALFNRLDEAIIEHKRARDLDPLRPVHTAWLGGLYNYAGRYDQALEEARKAMELNPDYGPSYYVMVHAYGREGMFDDAIAMAMKTVGSTSKYAGLPLLGIAYAYAGRRAEALDIAERLDRPRNWFTAQIYAVLGEYDKAIDLLEECYQDRTPILPWVRVLGGEYDNLHGKPRFQELLRKMNLPVEEMK